MNKISLEKMVIFFESGAAITERAIFKDETTIFQVNSYWKILLDLGNPEMKIILENCQDKSRKIVSYALFGKIFAMQTDKIIIMEEKDVPVIIKL